ncbi:hypothetical protein LZ30DRAFT_640691 [Colletotrichum cereale]|nr:hypothetical protein LZ30DRAFT_640691 [Colletotrichum cereale]
MSSVEPGSGSGSLGLVLLAHTTSCIVTVLFHCVELLCANLRLISLWFSTFLIAAKLLLHSTIESYSIVSASSVNTLNAWQTTLAILFWALSYTAFLLFIIPFTVVVILLERCETVYLRLHSSPFGAAAHEYLGLPPLDRPSLAQSDPSVASEGRLLSVPRKSPSFRTSTKPSKLTQPTCNRRNRIRRFIRSLTVCLLSLIEGAVTLALPTRTKATEPVYRMTRISYNAQKPVHLTLDNQSYRVAQATNFISTVKDALLSKIVERWGRLPTPTLSLRAFHLQMKPLLTDKTQTRAKLASPSRHLPLGSRRRPTERDVSLPASPAEVPSPATQQSPAPASPPSREWQPLRLVSTKEYTHPITGETWDTMLYVPPGAAQSWEALSNRPGTLRNTPKPTLDLPSRTLTVLSNLTASLSKSSLASFTASERKVSQQTVPSRKTSTSSTFGSSAPTRTATPTTPDDNPLIITTAQPSAYWAGRFLSLQDRFQGESLQEKTLSTLITAHATKATILAQQREAYKGRGNLPLSTTTALDRYGTAAVREANLLSDEDNRSLRIFLHLDALCGTPEAQKSLHAWQEAYARKNRRDALLPKGTGVERGFVARLFSGSSRRSLGVSRPEKETTKGKQLLSAF